jgi:hypothetical protein
MSFYGTDRLILLGITALLLLTYFKPLTQEPGSPIDTANKLQSQIAVLQADATGAKNDLTTCKIDRDKAQAKIEAINQFGCITEKPDNNPPLFVIFIWIMAVIISYFAYPLINPPKTQLPQKSKKVV